MIQYSSELELPINNICYAPRKYVIHIHKWQRIYLGFGLNENAPLGIIYNLVPKCLSNATFTTNNSELYIDLYNPNNQNVIIEQNDPICKILFKEEYTIWKAKTN